MGVEMLILDFNHHDFVYNFSSSVAGDLKLLQFVYDFSIAYFTWVLLFISNCSQILISIINFFFHDHKMPNVTKFEYQKYIFNPN